MNVTRINACMMRSVRLRSNEKSLKVVAVVADLNLPRQHYVAFVFIYKASI